MSIQHTSRVIIKGIWRDMITFWRYRAQVWGLILESGMILFGFLVFSGAYYFNDAALKYTGLSENDIFLFMCAGATLQTFIGISVKAPLTRIEQDIHYGTLEAIFVSPSSRIAYLLSPTISEMITKSILFIPMYIITLAIAQALLNGVVIGMTILIILISIVSQISMGIFFGMLAIVFRQTSTVANIIYSLVLFLCGAFMPVQAFMGINVVVGSILKYFAMLFPYTYSFDLMRYYLFYDTNYITLTTVPIEFIILVSMSILYIILAKIIVIIAEKKAKNKGLSIL